MRMLFCLGGFHIGGAEIFVINLAEFLTSLGHEIHFLVPKSGKPSLDDRASRIGKLHIIPSFRRKLLLGRKLRELSDIEFDYAMAVDSYSLIGLLLWKNNHRSNANILCGIFHPREFLYLDHWNFGTKQLLNLYQIRLIFMNDSCRISHAKIIETFNFKGEVIPVGIAMNSPAPLMPSCDKKESLRIISIGRLTDFKTYPFSVCKVLASSRDAFSNFQYDIYGQGELLKELQEYVADLNLGSRVTIHGELQNENFNEIVKGADIFIGMGLSAVQAASQGIPTLLAIESHLETDTYGFVKEGFLSDRFCLGEKIPSQSTVTIEESLLEFLSLSKSDLQEKCESAIKWANGFSIDCVGERYLQTLNPISSDKVPKLNRAAKVYLFVEEVLAWLRGKIKSWFFQSQKSRLAGYKNEEFRSFLENLSK